MSTDEQGPLHRSRLVAWCASLGALLVLLLVAAPASAHSTLVRSDPPEGGTVAVGRTELSLWFGEPIAGSASRFRLRTESGTAVPVTVSMPTGTIGEFVQLETGPLQRGVLELEWDTVSADDGHSSTGSLTFGVGVKPPQVAGSAGAPPRATEVVLRGVQLATLMLAIGALLAPGLLRRGADAVPSAPRQALRLGSTATLAALLSTLVAPLVSPQSSDLISGLSTTRWGQLWLVHVAALVAATAAFSALTRRGGGRALIAVAGCSLAVAAASDAAAGHSAELARHPAVAVAAATLHVLAAGAWVGTLAVLAACLLPAMSRTPALTRPLLTSTWRAFSPLAAGSVALVAASGLYLAGRQLPGLSTLTTSWYGAAAAGKVILLATTLVVAASTTLIVNPRLARAVVARPPLFLERPDATRFPRLVGIELALLGTAVVLASVMTSVPRPLSGGAPTAAPASVTVDGLFVSFESVSSGGSGTRLIVRTNAVTRPQPGPVTGVDVLLEDPRGSDTSATLTRIEPGRFEATVTAPPRGDVRVWLAVHRPSTQDAVAGLTWSGTPAAAGRTRLEPVTTPLSVVGVLGALAGLVLLRRSRSRRASAVPPILLAEAARSPATVGVGVDRKEPDA